ncbi:MAG: glycosyltransferase family 4 protein [Anaerolineales bacterium]
MPKNLRIFVLTNFYPPYDRGGYEQFCAEVCGYLGKRGHQVLILTSNYCPKQSSMQASGEQNLEIHRKLNLESNLFRYSVLDFFLTRRKKENENLLHLAQLLERFNPDLILIWGMWNLPRSLPAYLEKYKNAPTLYWLSDNWPAEPDFHQLYWSQPARHRLLRAPKHYLNQLAQSMLAKEGKPVRLELKNSICLSKSLKEKLINEGINVNNAKVIHHGVDLASFHPPLETHPRPPGKLSTIYMGGLSEQKGVHTAIQAISYLVNHEGMKQITLAVVGTGHPEYVHFLKTMIAELHLEENVKIYPRVPREQIPQLLSQYDCLIFPSIWEEPLGRCHLEAMACAVPVISTMTGGSKEIITSEIDGLTFTPGDSLELASQLKRLALDPELAIRLGYAGRKTVEERFDLNKILNEIERYFVSFVNNVE